MATKSRSRAAAAAPQSYVQPGREGRVQIKFFVEPDIRKRLKSLAVELDTSMEALLAQQIDLLLKKHSK